MLPPSMLFVMYPIRQICEKCKSHLYRTKLSTFLKVARNSSGRINDESDRDGLCSSGGVSSRTETSKQVLAKVFSLLSNQLATNEYGLKYNTENVDRSVVNPLWRTQLTLNWPQEMVFEGTGRKKLDAERIAASYAHKKLQEVKAIDGRNRPIIGKVGNKDTLMTSRTAKNELCNVYRIVQNALGVRHRLTYVSKQKKDGQLYMWETALHMTWPETKTLNAVERKKADAERRAATYALQHLKKMGAIDKRNNPLVHSKEELDAFQKSQRMAPRLKLADDLLAQVEDVVKEISSLALTHNQTARSQRGFVDRFEFGDGDGQFDLLDRNSSLDQETDGIDSRTSGTVQDVFSGKPYCRPNEFHTEVRSHDLWRRLRDSELVHSAKSNSRAKLPMVERRRELLDLVKKNQVVLLVGGTGCGKTTQVPQFILEEFCESMDGASCNIVVTQPKRIGATSVARRVAEERRETLGDVVGYRVRLDGIVPPNPGRILFCSTGDFLRRMLSNPKLVGISHVIVDEVHERDVPVDFILILLKEMVRNGLNPGLRVILMSATLDHEKLSRYFDDCPVCHVEGILHPVKHFYREDVKKLINNDDQWTLQDPFTFDAGAVTSLIQSIDACRPLNGAILCFLPGWQEIRKVLDLLRTAFPNENTHWVLPVHSRLSLAEQHRIFELPPPDVRKIILATDIAETSITVDDVAYVVDCGIHKELHYNATRGITSLTSRPITRSNVKQRSGRAGRTRSGECYHMFPEEELDRMAEFPTPELQRSPLEAVVLDAKAYFPDCKATDFLAKALDPPPLRAIVRAVSELMAMGLLDNDERLTHLGRLVLPFTAHPRLAKAIVYAAAFGCLDPILTVVALLSNYRDIFVAAGDDGSNSKKAFKKRFVEVTDHSDHLVGVSAFDSWSQSMNGQGLCAARSFCLDNGLNFDALMFSKGIKEQLRTQLLVSVDGGRNNTSESNNFCLQKSLVKSILVAAFTPRILHLKRGSVRKSRIFRDSITIYKLSGDCVELLGDSVNNMTPPTDVPWLTYFNSVHLAPRRHEVVQETSAVPFVSLLLFAGRELTVRETIPASGEFTEPSEDVYVAVDGSSIFRCQCSSRTAQALIGFRKSMNLLLCWLFSNPSYLISRSPQEEQRSNPYVIAHGRAVNVVVNLLEKVVESQ